MGPSMYYPSMYKNSRVDCTMGMSSAIMLGVTLRPHDFLEGYCATFDHWQLDLCPCKSREEIFFSSLHTVIAYAPPLVVDFERESTCIYIYTTPYWVGSAGNTGGHSITR